MFMGYKMPGGFEPIEVWIEKEYETYKIDSDVRFCKWDKEGKQIEGKVRSNNDKVAIIEFGDGEREEHKLKFVDRYDEIKNWRIK